MARSIQAHSASWVAALKSARQLDDGRPMRRTLWTLQVSQVGTLRASIDEQGRYFYGLRTPEAEVTGWQAVVGALVDHPALFPGPTAAEVQAADRATTYGRWFDHASGNDPRETYSLLAFPRGGWGLEVLGDRVTALFQGLVGAARKPH